MDSAHQEITNSCSRPPHTYLKSDRFTSQQVGQDRRHHWGLPIWPIYMSMDPVESSFATASTCPCQSTTPSTPNPWWLQVYHLAACQAWHLTHPVANDNLYGLPTTPASNQLIPEKTPSKGSTNTVPTAPAHAHPSFSYPESAVSTPPCLIPETIPPEAAVEPQQTIANPPLTPMSPSTLTSPTPKHQPSKTALALRRLMDYNKKGPKEPWTLDN